ncbi:hypothetical protein BC941DRAFT_436861 [Chlamydoabsidia padenii]|nr:hypothetical protein BC941DRAFT_436861 [Chlamydoabsidia padenii]
MWKGVPIFSPLFLISGSYNHTAHLNPNKIYLKAQSQHLEHAYDINTLTAPIGSRVGMAQEENVKCEPSKTTITRLHQRTNSI